jgi:hypothetical protein
MVCNAFNEMSHQTAKEQVWFRRVDAWLNVQEALSARPVEVPSRESGWLLRRACCRHEPGMSGDEQR